MTRKIKIGLCISFAMGLLVWAIIAFRSRDIPFNSAIWKENGINDDYKTRGRMAKNLLSIGILSKKTCLQARELLGKSDEFPIIPSDKYKNTNKKTGVMEYNLTCDWDTFHVYDPIITKKLILEYSPQDSTITKYYIVNLDYALNDR